MVRVMGLWIGKGEKQVIKKKRAMILASSDGVVVLLCADYLIFMATT